MSDRRSPIVAGLKIAGATVLLVALGTVAFLFRLRRAGNRLFALLVGTALAVGGSIELAHGRAYDAIPTRKSCRELGESGAREGSHVLLTDFVLARKVAHRGPSDRWSGAWVPAVPSDSESGKKLLARETDAVPGLWIHLLIASDDVRDANDLSALASERELEGMVIGDVEDLPAGDRIRIRESLGFLPDARVFEVGGRPKSAWFAVALLIAGIAVTVATVVSLLKRPPPSAGRAAAATTDPPPEATPP